MIDSGPEEIADLLQSVCPHDGRPTCFTARVYADVAISTLVGLTLDTFRDLTRLWLIWQDCGTELDLDANVELDKLIVKGSSGSETYCQFLDYDDPINLNNLPALKELVLFPPDYQDLEARMDDFTHLCSILPLSQAKEHLEYVAILTAADDPALAVLAGQLPQTRVSSTVRGSRMFLREHYGGFS